MANIKLLDIVLKNFKNIKYGEISFDNKNRIFKNNKGNLAFFKDEQTNIIGIYGQNGSGKTSVIEAIYVLKLVLQGGSFKNKTDYSHYIYKGENSAELSFTFLYKNNSFEYLVNYSFVLLKKYNQNYNYYYVQICSETIKYKEIKKNAKEKLLISWNEIEDESDFNIMPLNLYQEMKSEVEKEVSIKLAKTYSQEQKSSFFFNKKFIGFIRKYASDTFLNEVLNILRNYAIFSMVVIRVENIGFINAGILIPFSFSMKKDTSFSGGVIPIRLDSKNKIEKHYINVINELLRQLNKVLCHIIPDLEIYVKDLNNDELDKNNNILKNVVLMAKYPNYEIPLRYESNGIIKIISILGSLINVYNNQNVLLAVDELDSGIFEYMLGELLSLLDGRTKGQLLFTSHNLRILELISNDCIRFATTDPENKFGIIGNIKKNNNLRDIYLRYVKLGEDNNRFYSDTDKYEIIYAMRKSGNVMKSPDISKYGSLEIEDDIEGEQNNGE